MSLSIAGRVIEILEEVSGEGKNGTWRKRDFVMETGDQYPKKICVTQWGDEIDNSALQKGDQITAHIDIQSREYNGRWYTDVKAWRIDKGAGASQDDPFHGDPGFDPTTEPGFGVSGSGNSSGSKGNIRGNAANSGASGSAKPAIDLDDDDDLPF